MWIIMNLYHLMFLYLLFNYFFRISLIIASSCLYDIISAILFFCLFIYYFASYLKFYYFILFFILFCTVHTIRSCIFLYTIRTLLKGKLWFLKNNNRYTLQPKLRFVFFVFAYLVEWCVVGSHTLHSHLHRTFTHTREITKISSLAWILDLHFTRIPSHCVYDWVDFTHNIY